MPDYASLRLGSSAVNGPLVLEGNRKGALTSPTLAKSILPWSDYFLHALRLPGYDFPLRWSFVSRRGDFIYIVRLCSLLALSIFDA